MGEKPVNILVTYATHFGSTTEVADTIGETLRGHGHRVDVVPAVDDPPPDTYDAVVIGSAVQNGVWLAPALAYVEHHQATLQAKPTALFCVHIANGGQDRAATTKRLAYLDDLRPKVNLVDEAFFLGRFDRRGAALLMPKWLAFLVPTMDMRKWAKIKAWANALPAKFGAPVSV